MSGIKGYTVEEVARIAKENLLAIMNFARAI